MTNLLQYKRILGALALALMAGGLAGCAARNMPNGKTVYGLDEAGLLGKNVSVFRMPDGGEASVRVYNGHYSVKFAQYSRVFDIGYPNSVSFKSTVQIGDFAVLLLQKSEKNCPNMTMLLAIRGPEVRVWDVGSCATEPKVTVQKDALVLDIVNGYANVTRNTFTNGGMHYSNIPYQQYVEMQKPRDEEKERKIPQEIIDKRSEEVRNQSKGTGGKGPSNQKTQPSEQNISATSAAPSRTKSQQPVFQSTTPIFETKERAPMKIFLDQPTGK